MTKFLHFADLHINNPRYGRTKGGVLIRTLDIYKNLKMITARVQQGDIDFVLFAGDMYYDYRPPNHIRQLVHQEIVTMATYSHVVMIPGNHDMTKNSIKTHALKEFDTLGVENVWVVDAPKLLKIDGITLYCVPWQYEPFDAPTVEADIAIAHCTIPEAVLRDDGEELGEMVLGRDFVIDSKFFEDFGYTALGHIHKMQNWGNIVYPGSGEYLTWGEYNDGSLHGFVVGEVGGNWQLVPYTTRPREEIIIDLDTPFTLPPLDKEKMYRVFVRSQNPEAQVPHEINLHFEPAFEAKLILQKPRRQFRHEGLVLDANGSPTTILETYFAHNNLDFEEVRDLWTELQTDCAKLD